MSLAIKRWHIYSVDLEPRVGTKLGKQRPCLVIQPDEFNEAGLKSTVILPITSRIIKGDLFPLRIHLPAGTAGLKAASDIIVDQILAWDNSLFRTEIGLLPESYIEQVRLALVDFLDLIT